MKKLFYATLVLASVLLAVLMPRTLGLESRQIPIGSDRSADALASFTKIDESAAAQRLADALRFRTVSFPPPALPDTAEFYGLHRYLEATYPLVHERLGREGVGPWGLSLLFKWTGTNEAKAPVILMGHQDVVPVVPGTEGDWLHAPYAGTVADGYVWGRGAMDDKSSVLAILEAVEHLLVEGYTPERTIYLAFGHDEELGGRDGAAEIAALLEARSVTEYALVLDEGGAITDDMIPGVEGTTAVVGIGEKGYASLDLIARSDGGHSSTPPTSTAIGILAEAISELEEEPFPANLDAGGLTLLEYVAPEMPFGQRVIFANRWLFDPILRRLLARAPETDAMIRTTTAATMINAGVKDNVLPIDAKATVNFRILPGETVESVVDRVRRVIDDERIEISVWDNAMNPSRLSDPDGEAFKVLARTIRETVPGDIVVAPYLVMGGTDAKYYAGRSANVFRFLPAKLAPGDMTRVHGTGERLPVESFAGSIRFFMQLIRNVESLP